MTKIIIVGSGGLAADLTTFFENTSSEFYKDLSIKGYIDYEYNIEEYWKRYDFDKPVLSDIDNYGINNDEYFVIGIADVKFRIKVIEKIKEKGGNFINLIHPTALVPKKLSIGVGNIIGPYCLIGPNTQIGDFNLLLAQSIIGHDCVVGNNNILASTLLCGHVRVENDNYFGARSTVIPRITVGSRNEVQAGMIVEKNIGDDTVIFHRFKEKIHAILKDKSND